jgi:O-antigen ligase
MTRLVRLILLWHLINQVKLLRWGRTLGLPMTLWLKTLPGRVRQWSATGYAGQYYFRLVRLSGILARCYKWRRLKLVPWQVQSIEGLMLLYLILMPVWQCPPLLPFSLLCLLYWHRVPGASDHRGWELPGWGVCLALGTLLAGGGRQSWGMLGAYEFGLLFAWLLGRGLTLDFCRRLLDALLLSSVLWMAVGWGQQWSGIPTPPGWLEPGQTARIAVRSYAVFGNPNIYALYLVSIIGLALGWSQAAPRRGQRLGSRLTLILALFSLYFTYSRIGWLMAVTLCFWQLTQVRECRRLWLFFGVVAAFPLLWGGYQARIFSILTGQDSSVVYRWRIWGGVGRLLRENWLWGVGPGNFTAVYPWVQSGSAFSWHAHSFYLQLWLELGMMPLLLGLVWGGRLLIRELRLTGKSARHAVALGILGLVGGGLTESWQVSRFCREYGSLLVGMLLALQHKEQWFND